MNIDEIKIEKVKELDTAKADECYHRKKMEYNQERIKHLKDFLNIKED